MPGKPFRPPKTSGQNNNNAIQGGVSTTPGLMTSKKLNDKKEINQTFSRLKAQMNQAKVKTNIFAAIMKKPGFDGSPEKLVSTPQKINALLRDATDILLEKIPFDKENPVIRAVLYEPVSECIKVCWGKDAEPDPQMIANIYLEMFNNPVVIPEEVYGDLETNMLKESKASSGAVKCLGPIFDLQQIDPEKKGIGYLMLGEKMSYDNCLAAIKKMIAEKVETQVDQSCPEFVIPEEKNVFTRSVFNQVSEIFSQALQNEYKRLGAEVRALKEDHSGERQKAYLEKVKNSEAGVLLDNTNELADKMIHALYATNFAPNQTQEVKHENASSGLSLSA
jgi:hypothetical protein